jgi:hypothetical protein
MAFLLSHQPHLMLQVMGDQYRAVVMELSTWIAVSDATWVA